MERRMIWLSAGLGMEKGFMIGRVMKAGVLISAIKGLAELVD